MVTWPGTCMREIGVEIGRWLRRPSMVIHIETPSRMGKGRGARSPRAWVGRRARRPGRRARGPHISSLASGIGNSEQEGVAIWEFVNLSACCCAGKLWCGSLVAESGFAGTTISRGDLGRARRAVFGPWCEMHLAPGLERGLLVVFRKDHHPEGLGVDHREGERQRSLPPPCQLP